MAQAQRIDVSDSAIVFVFSPVHRVLKESVEQNRAWLESLAERAAGRRVSIQSQLLEAGAAASAGAKGPNGDERPRRADQDLRAAVLSDEGVQALLGRFPAEIRLVEEIDDPKH